MHEITLSHPADFAGWRAAARRLLAAGIAPEEVAWRVSEAQASLFEPTAPAPGEEGSCNVPRHFLRLAEQASLHADPGRFALLYRLLWRIAHGRRTLLIDRYDRDVARVEAMAAAVRRCAHKLKALVRFKEVPTGAGPHLVAWFEPEHHVLERTAPFFVGCWPTQPFSIVTPYRSAHWDGTNLTFGPGAHRREVPAATADEATWRAYHARILARVRPPAWPLPPAAPVGGQVVPLPEPSRPASLAEARDAAAACRACRRGGRGTGIVFGEGPRDAAVMLVGEQPGEAEADRPFAGPVGQLLDRALADAGLDRNAVYRTEAVKHARHRTSGGRRLPVGPEADEIAACRRWLDLERALVRPQLVVALGAVAAGALLERPVSLPLERGRIMPLEDGSRLLVTAHPATILALADATAQGREYRRLVTDLLLAVPYLRRAA